MRYRWRLRTVVIAVICLTALTASAQQVFDAARRATTVETLADLVETHYVEADLAAEMAEVIRAKLADGSYDELTNVTDLARALASDLFAISHDKHLGIAPLPPAPDPGDEPPLPSPEEIRAELSRDNFGFVSVRRLGGNVGYLDLRAFNSPVMRGQPMALDAAAAAMNTLAGSDALIIDLRANGGGDPRMVQFISSYLFGDEPVHLNSLYHRVEDDMQEFWTLDDIPGERMPDVPVYVLTSRYTFSAAEEFSYNLQALERATIVGETTGGGANAVGGFPIEGVLLATIPVGKAVNPITGTNWEGVGVVPDVETPQSQALERAHLLALHALAEQAADDESRRLFERWLENAQAAYQPVEVAPETMARYAGVYDRRPIVFQDGTLYLGSALTPLSETRFAVVDDLVQLEFDIRDDGRVAGVWLIRPDDSRSYLERVESPES